MRELTKLAIQAVEARDLLHDECRRYYGEGFVDGFHKAREMAAQLLYEMGDRCDPIDINALGESDAEDDST